MFARSGCLILVAEEVETTKCLKHPIVVCCRVLLLLVVVLVVLAVGNLSVYIVVSAGLDYYYFMLQREWKK